MDAMVKPIHHRYYTISELCLMMSRPRRYFIEHRQRFAGYLVDGEWVFPRTRVESIIKEENASREYRAKHMRKSQISLI